MKKTFLSFSALAALLCTAMSANADVYSVKGKSLGGSTSTTTTTSGGTTTTTTTTKVNCKSSDEVCYTVSTGTSTNLTNNTYVDIMVEGDRPIHLSGYFQGINVSGEEHTITTTDIPQN